MVTPRKVHKIQKKREVEVEWVGNRLEGRKMWPLMSSEYPKLKFCDFNLLAMKSCWGPHELLSTALRAGWRKVLRSCGHYTACGYLGLRDRLEEQSWESGIQRAEEGCEKSPERHKTEKMVTLEISAQVRRIQTDVEMFCVCNQENERPGIPWQSRLELSTFTYQGPRFYAWDQELRSHNPCGANKKKENGTVCKLKIRNTVAFFL